MTRHIHAILRGIGSVVDIYPTTDYRRLIPRQSPEERMRRRFERIGESLHRAIGRVGHEQKTARRLTAYHYADSTGVASPKS